MTCARCRGLLVRDPIGQRPDALILWRCLLCGSRTDLVIEVNRWRCRPPSIIRARKELKTLFSPRPAAALPASGPQ